jgi:hypothetical protein
MKRMIPLPGLLLAGGLALAPAIALSQDQPQAPRPEIAEGAEKLSEGLKLLFQGLLAEGQEGWEDLVDWLDDMSAYEAPERLPNGDIIIRRRAPLPLPEGETEL